MFRILGRPALLELAERPNGLQGINRHRYCNALVGAIVSVTGIQKRDEMVVIFIKINYLFIFVHSCFYPGTTSEFDPLDGW